MFLEWLSDPVRVLRLLNTIIAACCLLAGLFLADLFAGLAFALIGSVAMIQLWIINR